MRPDTESVNHFEGDLLIRRLTVDDVEAYRTIRLRALKDHPDVYTSSYADWDEPAAFFIERIEAAYTLGAFISLNGAQTLAGTLTLAIHERKNPKISHKAEIWSVYVAPEARERGIARKMMHYIMAIARDYKYEALMLTVTEHNTKAQALYQSLGFFEYGREPDAKRLPDGRRLNEILMQCNL